MAFQSTRPSRASTSLAIFHIPVPEHFNPQGPHGPRRPNVIDSADIEPISIHKALTGLDALAPLGYTVYAISIHKALTGLDFFHVSLDSMYANFNPQGPHGPRPRLS